MTIYYKENTGLLTAQDEKCDYFSINKIGADLWDGIAFAEIMFWDNVEHAQQGKPADLSRVVEWNIVKETSIDAGLETLFTSETLKTTNEETITLQNPTLV